MQTVAIICFWVLGMGGYVRLTAVLWGPWSPVGVTVLAIVVALSLVFAGLLLADARRQQRLSRYRVIRHQQHDASPDRPAV